MIRSRLFVAAAVALATGTVAGAQYTVSLPLRSPAPTALPSYATKAEIDGIIAHARAAMKPGQPVIVEPIHQFEGYTSLVEVRRGAWTAATHPDIEIFTVVSGTGTLILGGRIADPTPGKGGNVSGTRIEGGQTIRIGPGDVFHVPAETAHQFPAPDGELVLLSMHMPKSNAPAK